MLIQNVQYHYKALCINRNKTLKLKENYSTEMCTSVFFGALTNTEEQTNNTTAPTTQQRDASDQQVLEASN